MKKIAIATFIFLTITSISCSPRHYYKNGFVYNPSFDMFGAQLNTADGKVEIKSYIRSEIPMRTEYIYENFDISFPNTFAQNKLYSIAEKGVTIRYAKGGQAGQVETGRAKGQFTIKSISEDTARLDLELTFYSFTRTGENGILKAPKSVTRKGTLEAEKGFVLYR